MTAAAIILLMCSPILLGIFYGMTKDKPGYAQAYAWWDRATTPITPEQAQDIGAAILGMGLTALFIWLFGIKWILIILAFLVSTVGTFHVHSWYKDRQDGLE